LTVADTDQGSPEVPVKTLARVQALHQVRDARVTYDDLAGVYHLDDLDQGVVQLTGPARRTMAELRAAGLLAPRRVQERPGPVDLTQLGMSTLAEWEGASGLTSRS
jgi:hypothetical protein